MNDCRKKITELLAGLPARPTVLDIRKVSEQLNAIDRSKAGLPGIKIAVVSSFTTDMLIEPLVIRGYAEGFDISVYNAPFGQYMQEMINPSSGLGKFAPEVVFFAVRLQDACPEMYEAFNSLDKPSVEAIVSRWRRDWSKALETFRRHSGAMILCANYEQPAYPSLGLADANAEPSQCGTIAELNKWLRGLAGQISNFHVLDVDALAGRHGRAAWTEPKMWFLARSAVSPNFTWDYVSEIIHLLRAAQGRSRKVLALDCDNTLWGGILGEVGMAGIELGHDFPGSAYAAFQKRALELYHRGVVLIMASKNDHSAVMEVFEQHPEMILRPEHISYFGVNWEPKPDNLRRAAQILNLGLDSFVFIDDSQVECAMVQSVLPEVMTVCLPEDSAEAEMTLARLDCFDQLTISAEDRKRGQMYRQEAARVDLKSNVKDIEAFYHELKMTALVSKNDHSSIARVSQLTQRTNQFNMTTIRRTESQIKELMSSGNHDVFALRLRDRFGDNGIVGLGIVRHEGKEDILETFLMSCRVLGRTVETAFLSWIANESLKGGATKFVGLYQETPKNKQFGEFYKSWGMRLEGKADREGRKMWSLDLKAGAAELKWPEWIKIRTL